MAHRLSLGVMEHVLVRYTPFVILEDRCFIPARIIAGEKNHTKKNEIFSEKSDGYPSEPKKGERDVYHHFPVTGLSVLAPQLIAVVVVPFLR